MASTFPLKGSQLGSAHAPPPRSGQAARMGLPYPGAAQPGLQASGLVVTSLTWTRQKLWAQQAQHVQACLRALAQAGPCSGGPLPNTLTSAPLVKFYKPFGTLLQCYFSSVAFPDMAPTPLQNEQIASSFVFCVTSVLINSL